MIVFQKCVVMPRIFGGYWGALLIMRTISWKITTNKSKSVNKR